MYITYPLEQWHVMWQGQQSTATVFLSSFRTLIKVANYVISNKKEISSIYNIIDAAITRALPVHNRGVRFNI